MNKDITYLQLIRYADAELDNGKITLGEYEKLIKPLEDKVNTSTSASEKQKPKKVTHEATLIKNRTCPNCKKIISDYTDFNGDKFLIEHNYCYNCGQALDWSDEKCNG